jgi:hypothetical protein
MNQPPPWDPFGQQVPRQGPPQPPYAQGPQGPPPPPGPGRQSWPARHKVLASLAGAVVLFAVFGIGIAAGGGKTAASPAPTVTVTTDQNVPLPAVTVTATTTVTVTPTANAQGEATQISADGVYVVGTDIPGGTWHTSGGSQCYEATLASTDTSNIIDNNNFTGPDTVSLAGAKAFDISGGCTWAHEG